MPFPRWLSPVLAVSAAWGAGATPAAADTPTPGVATTKPASGWFVEHDGRFLVPYTQKIPGTEVAFEMIPAPGGVATVGPIDADRYAKEGSPASARRRVKLAPFWVAKHEVSWAEYWKYMELDAKFLQLGELRRLAAGNKRARVAPLLRKRPALWRAISQTPAGVDAITAPTPLYDPTTTYESGEAPNLPAVSMTVYAAKQYTKWVSVITGLDYRLPSEAEWEHAARAGGDGPFGAGPKGERIDAEDLGGCCWNADNADYTTHPIGSLQPNAWGVSDMLGNAAEWVLDAYRGAPAERADPHADAAAPLPWAKAVAWPHSAGPRIAKGGYFDAAALDCRIASRMLSDEREWKYSDPNIPTSPWWYSDFPATGDGFRLVRPLARMSEPLRRKVWEIDNAATEENVATRLKEGRGKRGRVSPDLPEALNQLRDREVTKLLR